MFAVKQHKDPTGNADRRVAAQREETQSLGNRYALWREVPGDFDLASPVADLRDTSSCYGLETSIKISTFQGNPPIEHCQAAEAARLPQDVRKN
jgi:hypothetical protein